ncbi:hypothetical protein ACUJ46_11140 [Sandaracinobacteroides sp. A072]|uniref:hypothetical protein n=1 Tax=Sandaracinobacteroides sp. A072 TaxID=3461146 RepID=UPI0040428F54
MPPANSLFRTVLRLAKSPALMAYAISGSVAVASFLSTFLLARISGAAVIGHYALAISTVNLLASLALFGLDRILIRQVAGDLREGASGQARAAIGAIAGRVGLMALAVSILWLLVLFFTGLNDWLEGDFLSMALVGAGILVVPFLRLGYSAIRANGMPVLGQFFEALPTLLLPLAFVSLWLAGEAPGEALATGLVIGFQALATLGSWLLMAPRIRAWDEGRDIPAGLLWTGTPLMAGLFLQQLTDWVILAKISSSMDAADVGAFRVSFQVITIILTIVMTSETYVAPRIAGDVRVGRYDLVWRRHRRATALMAVLASPVVLVSLLAPGWLLETAFGPEFAVAATALAIMAVGQVVHVARGPLGAMLTMAGHDGVQLKLTILGVVVGLVASLTLIPLYGLTGAALSQALPLVVRGLGAWIMARRLIPRHAVGEGSGLQP